VKPMPAFLPRVHFQCFAKGVSVEFEQDESGLIPFSNAVSWVYAEFTGTRLPPSMEPGVEAVVHEVAQAIADVATIYGASNNRDPIKALPPLKVRHGTFQRGATVVQTSKGIEYRRLCIRRRDVRLAVWALKHAGARFPSVEESRRTAPETPV
jgi:hypothetical protein